MESIYALKHGYIKDDNDTIVYEVSKQQTNLLEIEQLDELQKDDPLFFPYQTCHVDDEHVRIYYKKQSGYKPIHMYKSAAAPIKRQMAINMVALKKLIGTQYTTAIHPNNMYADDKGNVKLAHRGIRHVLPTEELTGPQLLSELKRMVVYLFTAHHFADITDRKVSTLSKSDPFINAIYWADSFLHLHEVLVSTPIGEQPKATTRAKGIKMSPRISILSAFLIGLILGAVLLYTTKVIPMTQTMDQQVEEQAGLQTKNEKLQTSLEESHSIVLAYEAAFKDEPEEAIFVLENIEDLNEQSETVLLEQYLSLETAEGYVKAAELGNDDPLETVARLSKVDNSDANEAILSMEADEPEVNIEKAWINEDYQAVIDIYDEITDNERAKFLAASSYIKQENHKAAMKLGKELENKEIQINSLNLQKDEIKGDDDMDDDKQDDKIEKLDDKIDKLK